MSEKKFIDLTVLNALVKELNKQVLVTENINPKEHHADHVVELSKAVGILSSINSEAMALIGDAARSSRLGSVEVVEGDVLDKFLAKNLKSS